ncbi:hypothetical protein AX14_005420 [Amanita brunnescens Koide BX004]|nr:hypothetical protein AX14_005420 [Amanita brunnescens Koide BX004]
MPAAPTCMLLHTTQDVPCFRGPMDSLFRYIAEVKSLCRKCQCAADDELIKWAVYYADETAWDTFAATRELLEEPKTWEGFKAAIADMYPQYEYAHLCPPLPASCPTAATPNPDMPIKAFTLDPAAIQALLSMQATAPLVAAIVPSPVALPAASLPSSVSIAAAPTMPVHA